MKRLLFLGALSFAAISCTENNGTDEVTPPVPGTTTIEMTASKNNLLLGDETTLTFTLAEDEKAVEDITINIDAKAGSESAQDLFTNFAKEIVLETGENSVSTTLSVVTEDFTGSVAFEISASARGYSIKESPLKFKLQDYIRSEVKFKGRENNQFNEGDKFIIEVALTEAASEDVVVSFATEATNFAGLPESVTVAKGDSRAETGEITITPDGLSTGDLELAIALSTTSEKHPLSVEELTLKVKDMDEPLGAALGDERHVYGNPNVMFVSPGREEKVQAWGAGEYVVISKDDPHPTPSLGNAGWKFQSALEFHYGITTAATNTTYNTTPCNALAGHTVAGVQGVAGIDNSKYSTVTEQGYLNMWTMKIPTKNTTNQQMMDYGNSAFYTGVHNGWGPDCMNLHEGTRIEVRARITGEKKGFNMAIWLVGNTYTTLPWPDYGEVDILENPASTSADDVYHGTFHFGSKAEDAPAGSYGHGTGNRTTGVKMNDWNIYWCEWRSATEIAVGVNGEEICVIKKENFPNVASWPYCDAFNPGGFRLILTMAPKNEWALGPNIQDGWDSGFAHLTNYETDRFNPAIPRMELDFVRVYQNSNYSNVSEIKNNAFTY